MQKLYDAKGNSLQAEADKITVRSHAPNEMYCSSMQLDTAGQYQLIEYLVGRIWEKEARRVDDRLKKILEAR